MDDSNIFPGYDSVEDYCKAVLQASLACCRASTSIDKELYEYGCTFKGFSEALAEKRETLISLMKKLIPGQKLQEHFENIDEEFQIDFLKEINSSIFENVSLLLEESDGEKKPDIELVVTSSPHIPINTSWNRKNHIINRNKANALSLLSAKNIARPQFAFKDKVDNSNSIFVPIIKEKPNSIRPLAIVLEKDEQGKEEFSHPYEWELERFEPQPELLESSEPCIPKPIEDTPLAYIDTVESLTALCSELKMEKELAVDMEHHSYRSFQGFTCLLQISTREKDYIIDALALRSELWLLNEIFTDPKIVKVFHGADMDILWLQRDFGVYVVNMFDTGQAARVLNFAHLSLAYLMKHYCNVEPDKQFQLADWRIRPLPEELLKYAREDTHYLLYIYDCMKSELLKKGNKLQNLLCSVFQRSKEICLKKYKKVIFSEDKYLELYRKSRKNFNPRQLFCLKELYMWRDRIARVEDESYGYILPNHMLIQICEVLPREHQGILACCNPTPPYVQHNLNEIFSIVSKANNYSLAQLKEPQSTIQPSEIRLNVDLNNVLHCPHDIHSYDDTRMHFKNFSENASSAVHDQILVPVKQTPVISFGSNAPMEVGDNVIRTRDMVLEKINRINKTFHERLLLTNKYHASLETDEENTEKEKHSKSYIAVQSSSKASESIQKLNEEQDIEIIEPESLDDVQEKAEPMEEITLPESPEMCDVSSRRKGKKRKRNKGSNEAQGSSSCPPRKKSKTPDSSFDSSPKLFQPFNYSKVSHDTFKKNLGKKHKKQSFRPEEFQTPKSTGKQHQRQRGHGKQATFSSNKMNSGSKHWPKK